MSALPAAIVLGCALIGAGLYLGLRARSVHASPSAATVPADVARATAPPLDMPPDDEIVRIATADAVSAFEQRRARLVTSCWVPSAEKTVEPSKVRWVYDITFGPDGRELARGLREHEPARPDAAQCAREMPLGLEIAPPGRIVAIALDVTMP